MVTNVSNMSTNNLLVSTQDDGKNIIFEVFSRYNSRLLMMYIRDDRISNVKYRQTCLAVPSRFA